jgi:hypothetical protein
MTIDILFTLNAQKYFNRLPYILDYDYQARILKIRPLLH